MHWGYAIAGALIGLVLGSGSMAVLGLAAGAMVGVLVSRLGELRRRVDQLEKRANVPVTPGTAAAPPLNPPPLPPPQRSPTTTATPAPVRPPAPRPVAATPLDGKLDAAFRLARQWITTGNVPVKIGVIVSFFGVGFLLKYAVDRRLFAFPIEMRLICVAVVAIGLLVMGWRLRRRMRVYALSLQGGAIGILYLVIFSAYRLYDLVPPVVALVLLALLAVGNGALAVLQDARGLAVLAVVGGFLAPIVASSGTGNFVALFTYYLVLSALVLAVAWFRPWRELNLIGFVFTFVVGGLWVWRTYEPSMYVATQTFVILFFLFYQAVAILYARRQPPRLQGVVDGTLVFATPVLVFAVQAVMLRHTEFGLAWSAAAAALFYALVALALAGERSGRQKQLFEAFAALGTAFATLAIPLALDARWTAASWALEGAALVWIGQRQERWLARAAGVLLVFCAGLAFLDHGWQPHRGPPLLNGNLLGGLLIALSAFFCARRLERVAGRSQAETLAGRVLVAFGAFWWVAAGTLEIVERVRAGNELAALTLFYPLSALLLSTISRRLDWRAGAATTFASLPLLASCLLASFLDHGHPLARFGSLAWPAAFAVQYLLLRRHAVQFLALGKFAHAFAAVLVALVVTAEVHWQADRWSSGMVWPLSAASFVPGIALIVIARLRGLGAWPVAEFPGAYLWGAAIVLLVLQWQLVLGINFATDGSAAPLTYLPLLNPADLASLFAVLCLVHWLRQVRAFSARAVACVAAIGFLVSTVALLRAMHHLGDVPWLPDVMFRSVRVQAALSVYWGLLAFGAMVWGARRSRRGYWLAGAGLMGFVVAKLFLLELGNSGTVARIVSFIAVGALLLVVGYLAPAPPRVKPGSAGSS